MSNQSAELSSPSGDVKEINTVIEESIDKPISDSTAISNNEEEEEEDDDSTPKPSNFFTHDQDQDDDDDDDNDDDETLRSPQEIIRKAAKDAALYNDYISYATVLDEVMSDPDRYTDNQRAEILETLLEVLQSDDKLVYEVGWDLPIPLLQYVESEYKFEENLVSSPHIRLVMKIFTVLSEKGNAKELFLKGVEALSNLKVYPEVSEYEAQIDQESLEIKERYGDMKFYLAYELMFFSLKRIHVQYPSRFLATAITVLLSFVASNLDNLKLLSLGVILRRLFTFARDYGTGAEGEEEEVSNPLVKEIVLPESEIILQQKLLQSFVTWVADFTLQRFSVRWAQRLYYELKAGVALEDSRTRSEVYELPMHTERVTECIERLAQLTYAFDMDVMDLLRELIAKDDTDDYDDSTKKINGEDKDEDKVKEKDDDDNTPEDETKSSIFSNLSDDGIFLLATQTRFDTRIVDPARDISFSDIVKLSLRIYRRSNRTATASPLGVQDALLFWALWTTRDISHEEVQKISQQDFASYLQSFMVLSAKSSDKESRFIAYSLTAKLLALHTSKVSFDFIVDTLLYCPFENIKDATVRMLKTFVLPRKPYMQQSRRGTTIDGISEGLNSLSLRRSSVDVESDESIPEPIIPLTPERIVKIQDMITNTLEEVTESGGILSENLPVLLSWLNFVNVIEVDREFLKGFIRGASEFLKSPGENDDNKEALRQRQGLLTFSIESVKKRWLD